MGLEKSQKAINGLGEEKTLQLGFPGTMAARIALVAILFSVYFFAGKFGLSFATIHPSASPIWMPTGIAIAALMVFGYRVWPVFFAGAFLFNFTTTGDIPTSVAIGVGNTLEGLIAAFWVNRYANGRFAFNHPYDIFKFVVLAGILAPIFSATIGVTSLVLAGLAPMSNFAAIWFTWWVGNATGALVVAPFIVIWCNNLHIRLDFKKIFEVVMFLSALIITVFIVSSDTQALKFLTIPFVIWSAFRFGQRGTALFVLLLSWIILFVTISSLGAYAVSAPQNHTFLIAQIFIALISVIGLTVSCVVSENHKTTKMLLKSEENLQLKVLEEVSKVKKTRERFQALFENAPDIITMCSSDGRINSINPAIEKIAGWTPEEMEGKNFTEIVQPDDVLVVENYFAGVLKGNMLPPTEIRLLRKSGGFVWVEHIRRPILEKGEVSSAFSINRDITERKKAQELVEKKFEIEKQHEAQKMEFLTMTSHELKTPLTPVLIQGELLLDGSFGRLSKPQKKIVEIIVRNVKRFNDLINDIFDITMIHSAGIKKEMEETDISKVIRENVENMKLLARKKNIAITAKIWALPRVIAAPNRIAQVMANLLDNAVKFTPEKGKILVEARKENGSIVVKVADTGIGIGEKDREMIFYHFYQARSSPLTKNAGTGLGLAICRSIVEMHGGKIWVESKEGKGSTFYFSLPVPGGKEKPNTEKTQGIDLK
ncbi:MAG: MASE1 domain-containing protein [Candidatus Diapherotrites archaeon]|nr:MASE1 domain-containing protein [Candidatus Diapherotrites archaeon]